MEIGEKLHYLAKGQAMEKEIIHFEQPALPVKLYRLNIHHGGTYRGLHSHAAVEIVEVKSGELDCDVDGARVHLHVGEIIFINSNTGHELRSASADISCINMELNFFMENTGEDAYSELYKFISRTKARPYMVFDACGELQELLAKINARYYENQTSSRWYLRAHIYELIAFMCSRAFIEPTAISAKQLEKIKWIVDYIDANFRSGITLDEICSAGNYNRYAVCHYFKSVTGATVFDYVNYLRIHFALRELKQTDHSILEIAANSGFSSPTYFNRVFKSMIGCSPSTYRKALTGNP